VFDAHAFAQIGENAERRLGRPFSWMIAAVSEIGKIAPFWSIASIRTGSSRPTRHGRGCAACA